MSNRNPLATADELVRFLATELHELPLSGGLRTRVSAACLAVSQEHHHAIVVLLQQERPLTASAFAIVRLEFEAYVRGIWLSHCATEEEVDAFSEGGRPPDMASLVAAVQKASQTEGEHLTRIYGNNWAALCAYTHTGAHQVQRWCTETAIEPNYTEEEVHEVLRFAGAIALLSAVSVAALGENELLARRLVERSRTYVAA